MPRSWKEQRRPLPRRQPAAHPARHCTAECKQRGTRGSQLLRPTRSAGRTPEHHGHVLCGASLGIATRTECRPVRGASVFFSRDWNESPLESLECI